MRRLAMAKTDAHRLSRQILAESQKADTALRPYVRETPLIPATARGHEAESGLLLKLETLQAGGSFKIRGALTKLLALPIVQRTRGVVAASTGNHGIAVAEAGRILNIPVTVFVPDSAPTTKLGKIT